MLDVYCILYFLHLLGGFLHICALYMYYICGLWPPDNVSCLFLTWYQSLGFVSLPHAQLLLDRRRSFFPCRRRSSPAAVGLLPVAFPVFLGSVGRPSVAFPAWIGSARRLDRIVSADSVCRCRPLVWFIRSRPPYSLATCSVSPPAGLLPGVVRVDRTPRSAAALARTRSRSVPASCLDRPAAPDLLLGIGCSFWSGRPRPRLSHRWDPALSWSLAHLAPLSPLYSLSGRSPLGRHRRQPVPFRPRFFPE
jgi:hypothetical protein